MQKIEKMIDEQICEILKGPNFSDRFKHEKKLNDCIPFLGSSNGQLSCDPHPCNRLISQDASHLFKSSQFSRVCARNGSSVTKYRLVQRFFFFFGGEQDTLRRPIKKYNTCLEVGKVFRLGLLISVHMNQVVPPITLMPVQDIRYGQGYLTHSPMSLHVMCSRTSQYLLRPGYRFLKIRD